ncbi:MAG: DUF1203 domain-containing protein [Pseudomonadota bacterium]
MQNIKFTALPTKVVEALWAGGADANGQPPERAISDGGGNPCRYCLSFIPEGEEMLILNHRPFETVQPYAESGPLFLCAQECERWSGDGVPPVFAEDGEQRLLKGYSPDDRIVYGLGRIVENPEIGTQAREMLNDPRVEYVHVRSATNNCFTCRIDAA